MAIGGEQQAGFFETLAHRGDVIIQAGLRNAEALARRSVVQTDAARVRVAIRRVIVLHVLHPPVDIQARWRAGAVAVLSSVAGRVPSGAGSARDSSGDAFAVFITRWSHDVST